MVKGPNALVREGLGGWPKGRFEIHVGRLVRLFVDSGMVEAVNAFWFVVDGSGSKLVRHLVSVVIRKRAKKAPGRIYRLSVLHGVGRVGIGFEGGKLRMTPRGCGRRGAIGVVARGLSEGVEGTN